MWSHLVTVYQATRTDSGLYSTKLKHEHVHLTSYSKMRVNLAAQVMVNALMTPQLHNIIVKCSNVLNYTMSFV